MKIILSKNKTVLSLYCVINPITRASIFSRAYSFSYFVYKTLKPDFNYVRSVVLNKK